MTVTTDQPDADTCDWMDAFRGFLDNEEGAGPVTGQAPPEGDVSAASGE